MCNLIIGFGVLNSIQKVKAIAKNPEYSPYLASIAIIDAATLYMMLRYCRNGQTMRGFFVTAVLESALRSLASAALEAPPPIAHTPTGPPPPLDAVGAGLSAEGSEEEVKDKAVPAE